MKVEVSLGAILCVLSIELTNLCKLVSYCALRVVPFSKDSERDQTRHEPSTVYAQAPPASATTGSIKRVYLLGEGNKDMKVGSNGVRSQSGGSWCKQNNGQIDSIGRLP